MSITRNALEPLKPLVFDGSEVPVMAWLCNAESYRDEYVLFFQDNRQVAFSRYEMEDLRREYDLILKEAGTATFKIPEDISEEDLWDLMLLEFFSSRKGN